jgi:hypothetical protein
MKMVIAQTIDVIVAYDILLSVNFLSEISMYNDETNSNVWMWASSKTTPSGFYDMRL